MFYSKEKSQTINVLNKVYKWLQDQPGSLTFNHHTVKKALGWDDHSGNEYVQLCLEYLICTGHIHRVTYDINREKLTDVEELSGRGHTYRKILENECQYSKYVNGPKGKEKRICDCPLNEFKKVFEE